MKKRNLEKLPVIDFEALSDDEKEAFYQECEKIGPDDAMPSTAADRRLHALARRRGRPKIGQGAKRVQVTMEASLLGKVDQQAKTMGLTRAQFLAQAARQMLERVA